MQHLAFVGFARCKDTRKPVWALRHISNKAGGMAGHRDLSACGITPSQVLRWTEGFLQGQPQRACPHGLTPGKI